MVYNSNLVDYGEKNNKNDRCKVFLYTSFLFMSKTFEFVLDWPEGLIVPFNDKSDLLAKYEETPSPVIVMADDFALIGELAGEILNLSSGYSFVILSYSSKDVLEDQFKKNKIFPEFQECFDEKIIIHHQIPCSIDTIKSLSDQMFSRENVLTTKQREVLNEIKNRIADKYDADQRHSMGNYMAADRILNGACRSGHYNLNDHAGWERASKAYENLINSNGEWNDDRKTNELKNAIKALKKFKNNIVECDQAPLWHESINHILIIDDEVEMWKPVWSFIFGSEKVNIIGNANEAINHLKDNDNKYDFVILDLNLGKDVPSGLSIIPVIKSIRFDLPIVVMTAYDNAEIAREAYVRGASFCFVKERRDKIDRKSKDYFKMLEKIFTFIPLNSSIERQICRKFQIIEPYIAHDNPDACAELRRSVFYLLLDPTEIRARKYLFGKSNEEWPRYQLIAKGCYDSFEIFIQKLLDDKNIQFSPIMNASEKYGLLEKHGHKIPMPNNLELYHGTGHEVDEEEKEIYAKETVLKFFQEIINYYKKYYEGKDVPKHHEEKVEDDSSQLVMYKHQNDDKKSHDERGKVGALRLLEGAYLNKFNESQYGRDNFRSINTVDELIAEYDQYIMSLLQKQKPKYTGILIDDNGMESGWKRALDLLLPESYVRYLEYTKSTECDEVVEASGKVDFIMLDLRLPEKDGNLSEETGIKLLKAIVEKYPYLPVITLTATDDAFYFRQVMSIGAFDYFPKTADTYFAYADDTQAYFSDYYLHFVGVMKKLYHHLENIKPIALLLERFDNFNHFKALDSLDTSGMKNAFWKAKSKNISKSVNSKVSDILKRSFFFLLGDQNISMHYLLRRLYQNNVEHSEWTMESHGFVEGIKASEYCLQILKTLYCDDNYHVYNRFSMGVLLEKRENTHSEFWNDNNKLHQDIRALWKKRNQISHEGHIEKQPIVLLQKAIENAVDVAKRIDSKVRRDFVVKVGEPQWDLNLLLGRSYFYRAIGAVGGRIYDNIVQYYFSKGSTVKEDFLQGFIHQNFRSLIKSALEKSDKTEEVEKTLKSNMEKWLKLFSGIPDKELLKKENEELMLKLKELEKAKIKLGNEYNAFLARTSGSRPGASKTKMVIEKKSREYDENNEKNKFEYKMIMQKIDSNQKIIDSIQYDTLYYLDTRNEILDKWYDENISMETHMEKKKLLSNYLEWNGIIDYHDFCKCFSDVFNETLPTLTELCSSLIGFCNDVLKEKERRNSVKSIIKKLYDYLKMEDRENVKYNYEWSVSYNTAINKHCLKIDNISIPISKKDMPEGIGVGTHKLMHWCCEGGYIKYELVKNS